MGQEKCNIQSSQVISFMLQLCSQKTCQNPNTHLLADYIGCLRSVGEVIRKKDAEQQETVYRKVDIESLRYAA